MGRKRHTPRGAAAKNMRDKELKDRERERAEAASKRKGRAERRRGEGKQFACVVLSNKSELDTPELKANDKSSMDEATGSVPPEAAPSSTHKRSNGRLGGKRRGKGADNDSPAPLKNGKDSPKDADEAASVAESTGTGVHHANGNGHTGHSRRGRAANGHHREPTMSELKKRAALMLEFIAQSRLEIERADTQGLAQSVVSSEAADLGSAVVDKLRKWQSDFTVESGSGEVSSGQ
jgi:hypothetical protein